MLSKDKDIDEDVLFKDKGIRIKIINWCLCV